MKVGAWENDMFIGVIVFSRGATPHIGTPYKLEQTKVCELTRVALRDHKCFVSEILSKAIKLLKDLCPSMRLIISFADSDQNHHGGIYQATNWMYTGTTKCERYFIIHGKRTHRKSIHAKYGYGAQQLTWIQENIDPKAALLITGVKHKYLMPLDKKMRKQILPLALPYPKLDLQK